MTASNKKTFVGIVASDKADKTITVSVRLSRMHPIYKKHFSVTKKLMAHDEGNKARTGDKVEIVSVAPISKKKAFYLKNIVEKAPIRFEDTIEKEVKEITQQQIEEKPDDKETEQ